MIGTEAAMIPFPAFAVRIEFVPHLRMRNNTTSLNQCGADTRKIQGYCTEELAVGRWFSVDPGLDQSNKALQLQRGRIGVKLK
jgi:hypothetical protein